MTITPDDIMKSSVFAEITSPKTTSRLARS